MTDTIMTRVFRRLSKIRKIISDLFRISALPEGKSFATQIREFLTLKFGPTSLMVQDYYWYNLANKDLYKEVDLTTFGGHFMTLDLHKRLNNALWDAVVTDKLIMAMVFSSTGIPHPKMYAAACHFARSYGDLPVFSTKQELSNFLVDGMCYPFFCKPIKGGSGEGCYRVEAFDSEKKQLRLADGSHLSITNFLETLVDPTGWGFLFQEAVLPHPDTAEICGSAVSGCRIVMLLDDERTRPFRVVWKIPIGDCHIDSFTDGGSGNLAADVDIETGRVSRAVSGIGTDLRVISHHPDTGANIVGTKVPEWERMMTMIKKASLAFSGFRFQHWDVGLTSSGPIVYELNTAGALSILEMAKGSGVYDAELKAFIECNAEEGRRPKFVGMAPVPLDSNR